MSGWLRNTGIPFTKVWLVTSFSVASLTERTSHPSISGAELMHHSTNSVRYSSSVQPVTATLPLPYMPQVSMSTSLKQPGAE